MQGFKKLALVAAIAAVPAASFAMQPMNDSQMSGVTGQDGITLSITTNNLTLGQTIYDRDGMGSAVNGMSANGAGAIVITGMQVNTNGNAIVVDVDAGQSAGGAPVLNVGVTLPNNIQIATGDLSIANTTGTRGDWTTTSQTGTIMDSSTITLGTTTLNIQLGGVAQTMAMGGTYNPMILVSTTITGGISVTNTSLHDLSTAKLGGNNNDASIFVDKTTITDAGGTDLTVGSVGINVAENGLVIGIADIGSANGLFIGSEAVRLGGSSAAAIGDVAITGLQLSGTTITVSGH